ncbi:MULTISPECIES: hypothetical protein [Rhodomicrobium]|nr:MULTISPECIES: hypothetical protein [Rhodomicrobium]
MLADPTILLLRVQSPNIIIAAILLHDASAADASYRCKNHAGLSLA